jgi:hypothetical protein
MERCQQTLRRGLLEFLAPFVFCLAGLLSAGIICVLFWLASSPKGLVDAPAARRRRASTGSRRRTCTPRCLWLIFSPSPLSLPVPPSIPPSLSPSHLSPSHSVDDSLASLESLLGSGSRSFPLSLSLFLPPSTNPLSFPTIPPPSPLLPS